MSIISLFCEVDDFFLAFEKYRLAHQLPVPQPLERRGHPPTLHISEVMTLLINFHQSGYRTFKTYYEKHARLYLRWAFPNLVSYNRFVELMAEALPVLTVYLYTRFGNCGGISFIDSTPLTVCHNRRIARHRVFAKEAERTKNSLGWFYGFKLHLVINTDGELLSVDFTPANTDDRVPVAKLARPLFGKLYADKGYICKTLREHLATQGVDLVYKVRKNMDPLPLSDTDVLMLKRRMLVESVIKELKTQTQLQHTRHRSFINFHVNMVSALIAYTYLTEKPSLNLREIQQVKDSSIPANFYVVFTFHHQNRREVSTYQNLRL